MATYEIRRNSAGEPTAIRVKLRRTGQPHLSRSFPLAGDGPKALKAAEAAARAWVHSVESQVEFETGGIAPAAASPPSTLARHWQLATQDLAHGQADIADPARPVWLQGDPLDTARLHAAMMAAPSAAERGLLSFVLQTGQPPDALARLRWQHVRLDARCVEVRSLAGVLLRTVPLSPDAIDALLGMGTRKHGLIFKQDAHAIYASLTAMARAAGVDVPTLYRAAMWRLHLHGHNFEQIAGVMGLTDFTALQPTSKTLRLQQAAPGGT